MKSCARTQTLGKSCGHRNNIGKCTELLPGPAAHQRHGPQARLTKNATCTTGCLRINAFQHPWPGGHVAPLQHKRELRNCYNCHWTGREENCSRGWAGHGGPFPSPPPPPFLVRHAGRGVSGRGCPACRAGGGGGSTPTYLAQNDPHVPLIILTTHMLGKDFQWKKTLSGQNLCSGAFGVNIHCCGKKRPGMEAHFSNPPPPRFRRASAPTPPPPPPTGAIFRSS